MESLTYKKAGVDIEEGDRFVDLIKPLVRRTFRPEVLTDIGSFGAFFALGKYRSPVLVSGTDGVGTKLKVAFLADRHDTIGIDLVAMCVNDILTSGAEPLFFLDYFATGKLRAEKARDVVKGIAKGCKEAGCALVGGETAEMPGFYEADEYDLAGFAVGVVEKKAMIDGSRMRKGDVLIGLASNGLHSNGYSLARKVLLEKEGLSVDGHMPELGHSVADELLRPTRIYVKAFKALQGKVAVRGMAHITGGGIEGNVPRMIPKGFSAVIDERAWPVPPVFSLIAQRGNVPLEDMRRTFNMGIGYVIVITAKEAPTAVSLLRKTGYAAYPIGYIEKGGKATLRYV